MAQEINLIAYSPRYRTQIILPAWVHSMSASVDNLAPRPTECQLANIEMSKRVDENKTITFITQTQYTN